MEKLKNWNFENFQIQWLQNKFIILVVTFFQVHLRNTIKIKQNQQDDLKVKILENQSEFDILTKDSVWNIDKLTLKSVKNKINNI